MQTLNNDDNGSPLFNNWVNKPVNSLSGVNQPKVNKQPVLASHSNLIITENVSFIYAIILLLWKNYKQQLQRRKISWIIKMLLPVMFTIILGTLRNGYTIITEPVDYGYETQNINLDNINKIFNESFDEIIFNYSLNVPYAIDPISSKSNIFITLPLCAMNWTGPAPFIGITPKRNTNKHIDAVLDIMNRRWVAQQTPNQTYINTAPYGCIQYAKDLPFTQGWLLKYFDSDNSMNSYCKQNKYGSGFKVTQNINDSSMNKRPIAFGISFSEPSLNGLEWKYKIRFNASGATYQKQQGGQKTSALFSADGTLFPIPTTNQPNINNFNRNLQDQWTTGSGNYYYSFFIHIQNFIDNSISEYIANISGINYSNTNINDMTKGFFVFPTNEYKTDNFWYDISRIFVFFILIGFVYPYSQVVKDLVEEKSNKIKEGLKMMGATATTYWMSWYLWFL
eukprot:32156_1